jgi:hypothetical protein
VSGAKAADGNLRPPCGTPAPLSSGPGLVTGGVVFSKLSKLLNQEDALGAPCLQHFRNLCFAIEVARCGFPWEKTTKRPVASISTNCETSLHGDFCSPHVPSRSAGILRKGFTGWF